MADDSTFGGGLALSGSFGGGVPASAVEPGTDVPPAAATPDTPPDAPTDVSAQSRAPAFGSGFANPFAGRGYRAPDPAASPLEQTADVLEQRIARANKYATDPVAQFFNPDLVAQAKAFGPAATEQLLKIRQQQAAIKSGRQQAETLGLAPGEVPDEASMADRVEAAKARALKGDMRAFQGLQAVAPKDAEAIQDQVHEVVAGHLTKAQFAFDKLSGVTNQGQYAAAVAQMRRDGTLSDLEALGLKVPPTFDAFNATKGAEGKALRDARVGVDTIRQKLEERNTYQPMEEKEAKTYDKRIVTPYGDVANNGTWSRNAAAGTRGMVVNGAADPRDLGKKYTLGNDEQRKSLREEAATAVPKEDMEKARAFTRTYKLAVEDAKGNKMPDGKINTNPNVQQGIAEGLASMLRGGSGGANVGLLKIELLKRGWTQGAIDGLISNYNGALNTLFANANRTDKPYLSEGTQKQIRDVMDVLKTYNDQDISGRMDRIGERAGALGFDSSAFGLRKGELPAIDDAIERGRQAMVQRLTPFHQAIGGGDGVFQIGAQRPGAGATSGPPGTANTTQLPGAPPVATPVQQAAGLIPPRAPLPPGVNPDGTFSPSSGAGGGSAPPAAPSAPAGGAARPSHVETHPPTDVSSVNRTPPTDGPTPGRYGLPPGMTLDSPAALDAAANRTIQIESGFKPGAKTGSYVGYGQWSAEEMKRHSITDPNDLKQTQAALKADIQARAAKLQKDGLPATPANVYLMHQQGEAGLEAHLRNPDGAAWENVRKFYKSDAIAKQAIWGNMTPEMRKQFPGGVNDVKSGDFTRLWEARYNGTDNPQGASIANVENRRRGLSEAGRTAPRAEETPAQKEAPGFLTRLSRMLSQGIPEGERDKAVRDVGDAAVEHAPAIGSTAGAALGSVGGVPGVVAGGAAGGGAGQMLKDYIQGNGFNGPETAKQAALGGVLGVAPEGRAITGAVTRSLGAGAVEAGSEAAKGGSAEDITNAGLKGTAAGATGEMFGRALGMAGHKVWSMFAPDAKKAVQEAAAKYAAAEETLKTETPKLPGVNGAAGGPNPKYEAAQTAKTEAERTLTDAGLKPEEAAYAHKVATEGVPKQEAEVARPGALEQERLGKGYARLEQAVGEHGVGAPKAAPKLNDGPVAVATANKMSPAMRDAAERTEMAITAPAKSWQDKWTQLKDARSALLDLERDALSSTTAGRTQQASDYRALADAVRKQQEKVANYVFGSTDGPKFMGMVKTLDVRYRKLMEATNGGDLAAAAKLKGDAGREADRRFRALAHDDPQALKAWDAMRGVKGDTFEATVPWTVAAEGLPVVGKVIKVTKLAGMLREWARERTAGSPVRFADFARLPTDDTGRLVRNFTGTVGQRTALQE